MATSLPDRSVELHSGQMCPNCRAADFSSETWCKQCGYYARTGTCVELDPDYECYSAGRYVGTETAAEPSSPIDVLLKTPNWAWQLATVLVTVTFAGLLVRMATTPGTAPRILSVVGMVLAGGIVLVSAHVAAGVRNYRRTADFPLIGIILYPLRLWIDVGSELPQTFKYVALGLGGFWAVVVAHVFVGVPYFALIDLSAAPPKRPTNRIAEIVAAAAQEDRVEALTLEEALAEVAGVSDSTAAIPGSTEPQQKDPETELATLKLQAVIIGYNTSDGEISSLVVAVSNASGWRVLPMTVAVPPDTANGLSERFAPMQRAEPFVANDHSATWLEPIFRCSLEATFDEQQDRFESADLLKLH